MPNAITGSSAGHNPAVALTFNGPSDTEGIDAVDVNVPFQDLADGVQYYNEYGARTNRENTFEWSQTIEPTGALNDDYWLLRLKEAIGGTHQLAILLDDTSAGAPQRRIYMSSSGVLTITVNAAWDPAGPNLWFPDDAAQAAARFRFTGLKFAVDYHAAAASWADGAWTSDQFEVNAATGDVIAQGDGQFGGGLEAQGLIESVTGDVKATDGNLVADGTPVSSAGPGIVQTSRLTSIGTKIIAGNVGTISGYGGAGSCTAVLGTDLACEIEITCDTTGAAASNPASFSFTFRDGTFTDKPQVMVAMSNSTDATILGAASTVRWTNTATAVAVYLDWTPIHTKTYTFRIFTVGAPA